MCPNMELSVDIDKMMQVAQALDRNGRDITNSYKRECTSVIRELDRIASKYSEYSSVTSRVRAIQNHLNNALTMSRDLEQDYQRVVRGLKGTVRLYREEEQETLKLVRGTKLPSGGKITSRTLQPTSNIKSGKVNITTQEEAMKYMAEQNKNDREGNFADFRMLEKGMEESRPDQQDILDAILTKNQKGWEVPSQWLQEKLALLGGNGVSMLQNNSTATGGSYADFKRIDTDSTALNYANFRRVEKSANEANIGDLTYGVDKEMDNPSTLYYNIDFSKLSEPQRITIQRLLKEYDRQPYLGEVIFGSEDDWNNKKEYYLEKIMDIVDLSEDPDYKKFLDVYTKVVEPTKGVLQVAGGVTESITGVGLVAGTTWTGVGIPVGVAGGYMAVDGASNVLGGLSRIKNGLSGSTEGDTLNFMKKGYIDLFPENGEQIYNLTQVGIGLYCIGKGITELPKDAVKVFPRAKNIARANAEGLSAKTVILDMGNKVIITSQTESGMILTRTVVNKAQLSKGSLLLIGVDSYNTKETTSSLNNK